MRKSQKVALSGLLTAFAAVMVMISNIMPAGMYTFPAAAGVIVYILSSIVGRSYGWASFGAIALLSFFLCADKEAALSFILFFGYYPMIKQALERIPVRFLAYLPKLAIFNAAAVSVYFLMLWVFALPADTFEFFGINMPLIFLLLLNFIFLLYDYAITVFMKAYQQKIYNFVTKVRRKF